MKKIQASERQIKVMRDFTDKNITRLYDVTWKLKVTMFYCRVMSKLWNYYHKYILHRAFFTHGMAWFFTSCLHHNPYKRAYNDMQDFQKSLR